MKHAAAVVALVALLSPLRAVAEDAPDLFEQVRGGDAEAAAGHGSREARFRKQRDAMASRLQSTRNEVRRQERRVARARAEWETATRAADAAEAEIVGARQDLEDLYDAARAVAVDLYDDARSSFLTAQYPGRLETLAPLAASEDLPGPKDLETLWTAMQADAVRGGEIVRFDADVVTVNGLQTRRVIRAGTFTAFAGGEFFTLGPDGTQLYAMPRQPQRRLRNVVREFEAVRQGLASVVVDPSRGPLLVADANQPGLFDRLWSTGVGGYFMSAVLLIAIALPLVQALWLRSRLILDEQSIGVTAGLLFAFALVQWWMWVPRAPASDDEVVAYVDLVNEEELLQPDEPPPPELKPPPPPPEVPTSSAETGLSGLPALKAPTAAPLLSDIAVPVNIAGGGSLTGQGFGGFARGRGQGAGAGGFGRGAGFKGRPLIPLSTARPQMPEWACRQKIRGWVEAVFTVLPNGRVQNVRIIDAEPRGVYEIAAIESISNWIYAETGQAREVKQRVPMDPADCAFNWQ